METPGVGAVISSPFTLAGTASVFEGSFIARLVDSSGRRIVNTPVQASLGAPGRGRFAKETAFSTSAARGTLIVYAQSMEDGSRQNVSASGGRGEGESRIGVGGPGYHTVTSRRHESRKQRRGGGGGEG